MAKNNQAPAAGAAPVTDPAPVAEDQQSPPPEDVSVPPTGNDLPPVDPPAESELRKVLLLVDNAFGRCAQVVKVLVHEAEAMLNSGEADDHPAAIAAHED